MSEHPEEHVLSSYALRTLEDGPRTDLEQHLSSCPSCVKRLSALEARVLAATRTHGPGGSATPASAPLTRGANVSRYLVIEQVGAGGMGEVYAAYDPQLDRRIALKVLRDEGDPGGVAHTRMVREAQSLARLQHPNVVAVHDVGLDAGRIFLAMELVRGQNLRAWLKTPRDWKEIVAAFVSAGNGLAAAHQAGIIHRDFKPDNVLIGDDGRVRVVDFGLAQQDEPRAQVTSGAETPALAALATSVTQEGSLPGTLAYMAPEQLLGLGASPRSDQFSFCVSLFEALNGRRPFVATNVLQLHAAFKAGPPPPSSSQAPDWINATIARGLAVEPAQRFADLQALLAALAPRQQGRRAPALVAVALGVVLLSMAGIARYREGACDERASTASAVWQTSQPRIEAAFQATGLPYASEAAGRVGATLQTWAADWSRAQKSLCAAPGEAAETSRRCLEDRLAELRSTLEVLETADRDLVPGAPAAARGLEPAGNCLDPGLASRLLTSGATASDEVRATLRSARALQRSGRYAEAARQLDGLPGAQLPVRVVAEALILRAAVSVEAGEADTLVRPRVEAAMKAALETRDPSLIATTFARRAVSAAVLQEPHQPWLSLAQAAARGAGDDPVLALELEDDEATIAVLTKDWAEAERRLRGLLAHCEERFGVESPVAGTTRTNLAIALARLDRKDEAVKLAERALAIGRNVDGASHPSTALKLHNLAVLLRVTGRYRDSRIAAQQAVDLRARIFGEDARQTWQSRSILGYALHAEGSTEDALALMTRQLEALDRGVDAAAKPVVLYGSRAFLNLELERAEAAEADIDREEQLLRAAKKFEGEALATSLEARGQLLLLQGQLVPAEAMLKRSLELWMALGGDGAESCELLLAEVAVRRGAPREAVALAQTALAQAEKAKADGAGSADALVALGVAQRLSGRLLEARASLERAISIRARFQNAPRLAIAQLELAQVLAASGDAAGASQLAGLARPHLKGKNSTAAAALLVP